MYQIDAPRQRLKKIWNTSINSGRNDQLGHEKMGGGGGGMLKKGAS